MQVVICDIRILLAFAFDEVCQFVEIRQVSVYRVGRKRFFQTEVCFVSFYFVILSVHETNCDL